MTQWVRGIDTAIGAAGGGAVGLLSYLLFSAKKKPSDPLLHVLTGAAAGMGVANVAGTLGRRYFSNVVNPYNYEAEPVLNSLKPKSWSDAWDRFKNQAVNDEIHPDLLAETKTQDVGPLPRRELVRRNMGVHNDNPQEDWFVKNKEDDTYRLNEAMFTKQLPPGDPRQHAQAALQQAMNRDLPSSTSQDAFTPTSSMKDQHAGHFQKLLGGYETALGANGVPEIRDTWTYELSPGQTDYLKDATKARVMGRPLPDTTNLIKNDADSAWYYGGNTETGGTGELNPNFTPQDVYRSLGSRWLADQVFDTNQTKIRTPLSGRLYFPPPGG